MDGSFPRESLDQASLSLAELADQITELAGHLNAGNYRWLDAAVKEIPATSSEPEEKLPGVSAETRCGST